MIKCQNITKISESLVSQTIEKYRKNDYISVANTSFEIKTEKNKYQLIRLRDDQYIELRKNSVPIKEDYFHHMNLYRAEDIIFSSLSKMHTVLKYLFGESGRCFDDWKCSFSFPFLIIFKYNNSNFEYLMNVIDIKGGIELLFYKLVHVDDELFKEREIIRNYFEEFSHDEMIFFTNFFAGFLTGYYEKTHHLYTKSFFKTVSGQGIIYGFRNGQFFDKRFENESEFEVFINQLNED